METVEKKIDKGNLCLQNNSFDLYEGGGNYINLLRMYHGYFNQISNIKSINGIDPKDLLPALMITTIHPKYFLERNNA